MVSAAPTSISLTVRSGYQEHHGVQLERKDVAGAARVVLQHERCGRADGDALYPIVRLPTGREGLGGGVETEAVAVPVARCRSVEVAV